MIGFTTVGLCLSHLEFLAPRGISLWAFEVKFSTQLHPNTLSALPTCLAGPTSANAALPPASLQGQGDGEVCENWNHSGLDKSISDAVCVCVCPWASCDWLQDPQK